MVLSFDRKSDAKAFILMVGAHGLEPWTSCV
jgi:hypothetical protein